MEIMNISYKGDRFIMKIKNGKALLTLAAVWILAFVLIAVKRESSPDSGDGDIVTAFATAGEFVSTKGTVSAYVNYGNEYLTDDDRKILVEKIAKAIGIEKDIELDIKRSNSNGSSVTATYSCIGKNSRTDISIITIEDEKKGNSIMSIEQYILVDISIDNSVESAVYYKECIDKYFKADGIDADITLSFKGSIEGTLSNNQKNEICENIINALDGELITGSRSEELYTVYAYSDSIREYVVNGTTKSNINVAITYDSKENLSWVYVATPILMESY